MWHLSIGISHNDLTPVGVDLRTGRHAIVTGPTGGGKTTALRALASAARAADPDAYVAVESARPEEWDDAREALDLTDLDFLINPDSPSKAGRRTLLIIDGVESVPVPAGRGYVVNEGTATLAQIAVVGSTIRR